MAGHYRRHHESPSRYGRVNDARQNGRREGEGYQIPPQSESSHYDRQSAGLFREGTQRIVSSSTEPSPLTRPPPPHAPQAMRDDRSVTLPPPRPPSPAYLALSKRLPSRIEEPSASRKLLVLDLNGTLLHRSPHNPRPKTKVQSQDDRPRDGHGSGPPRLRPVHPRPYMCAFRSYLFAPQTRTWLDVMVWSSAQPHSVGDMVDKCFGEDQDNLLAIWARDTLGLSTHHYHRKVQTVKDLTKPWSLLSQPTPHIPSSPHSSIASTPRTSPEPSSPSRPSDESIMETPQAHSALTTLLLDDSPRKAGLQPFNHVCIGEYSGEKRAKDLESLQREQEWGSAVEAREQLDAQMAEVQGSGLTHDDPVLQLSPKGIAPKGNPEAVSDELGQGTEHGDTPKKLKRKAKKLQKRAALLEHLEETDKPNVTYDETLLAVIGVLDEIKSQANVAAWIRSGGLWGPSSPPAAKATPGERADTHVAGTVASGVAAMDETAWRSDTSDLSVGNARSLPPLVQPHAGDEKPRKRKKRQRMRESISDGLGADVGNDAVTVTPATSSPQQDQGDEKMTEDGSQVMWFEKQQVLDHWAMRGRKALEELEITVEHGIER
ncbi:hypothetical protein BC628DRAFT_1391072 [Trametes gibbosa]|nr:hypothetical protein BC628DRAFT_1391072 [Trametes gibbosa]